MEDTKSNPQESKDDRRARSNQQAPSPPSRGLNDATMDNGQPGSSSNALSALDSETMVNHGLREMRTMQAMLNNTINRLETELRRRRVRSHSGGPGKAGQVAGQGPGCHHQSHCANDSRLNDDAEGGQQWNELNRRRTVTLPRWRFKRKASTTGSKEDIAAKRQKTQPTPSSRVSRDAECAFSQLEPQVTLNRANVLAVMEIMDAGMHEVANRAYTLVDDLVDMANTGVEEVVNMAQGGVVQVVQMAQTGMGEIMGMAQKGVHDVVDKVDVGIREVMHTAKAGLQSAGCPQPAAPMMPRACGMARRMSQEALDVPDERSPENRREKKAQGSSVEPCQHEDAASAPRRHRKRRHSSGHHHHQGARKNPKRAHQERVLHDVSFAPHPRGSFGHTHDGDSVSEDDHHFMRMPPSVALAMTPAAAKALRGFDSADSDQPRQKDPASADPSERKQRSRYTSNASNSQNSIDILRRNMRAALESQGIWGALNENLRRCEEELRENLDQARQDDDPQDAETEDTVSRSADDGTLEESEGRQDDESKQQDRSKAGASGLECAYPQTHQSHSLLMERSTTRSRSQNPPGHPPAESRATTPPPASAQHSRSIWRNKASNWVRILAGRIPGASFFSRAGARKPLQEGVSKNASSHFSPALAGGDARGEGGGHAGGAPCGENLCSACRAEDCHPLPDSSFCRQGLAKAGQGHVESLGDTTSENPAEPVQLATASRTDLLSPQLKEEVLSEMKILDVTQSLVQNKNALTAHLRDMWMGIAEVLLNFLALLSKLSETPQVWKNLSPDEDCFWRALEVTCASIKRIVSMTNAGMEGMIRGSSEYDESLRVAQAGMEVIQTTLAPLFARILSDSDNIDMIGFVQLVSDQLLYKVYELERIVPPELVAERECCDCWFSEPQPVNAAKKILKAGKAAQSTKKVLQSMRNDPPSSPSEFSEQDEYVKTKSPIPVLKKLCKSAKSALQALSGKTEPENTSSLASKQSKEDQEFTDRAKLQCPLYSPPSRFLNAMARKNVPLYTKREVAKVFTNEEIHASENRISSNIQSYSTAESTESFDDAVGERCSCHNCKHQPSHHTEMARRFSESETVEESVDDVDMETGDQKSESVPDEEIDIGAAGDCSITKAKSVQLETPVQAAEYQDEMSITAEEKPISEQQPLQTPQQATSEAQKPPAASIKAIASVKLITSKLLANLAGKKELTGTLSFTVPNVELTANCSNPEQSNEELALQLRLTDDGSDQAPVINLTLKSTGGRKNQGTNEPMEIQTSAEDPVELVQGLLSLVSQSKDCQFSFQEEESGEQHAEEDTEIAPATTAMNEQALLETNSLEQEGDDASSDDVQAAIDQCNQEEQGRDSEAEESEELEEQERLPVASQQKDEEVRASSSPVRAASSASTVPLDFQYCSSQEEDPETITAPEVQLTGADDAGRNLANFSSSWLFACKYHSDDPSPF